MPNFKLFNSFGPRRTISPLRLTLVVGSIAAGLGLGTIIFHGITPEIDLRAYWQAAGRLLDGQDIYPHGLGIGNLDAYPYPPILAEILTPLHRWLDFGAASIFWQIINTLALLGTISLAWRAGGGKFNGVGLLSLSPLVFLFLPLYSALLIGNVSIFVALVLALGLATGPSKRTLGGFTLMTSIKLAPVLFFFPTMLAAKRRNQIFALCFLTGILLLGVALYPDAWRSFMSHLQDLTAGTPVSQTSDLEANAINNLLPGSATLIHLTGFLLAGVFELIALGLALRGRWTASLTVATGALLIGPGVIWYHYFIILLPLILAAWPSLYRKSRLALVPGYLALAMPVGILPFVGAGIIMGTLLSAALKNPEN
jgi:hypothetical protein